MNQRERCDLCFRKSGIGGGFSKYGGIISCSACLVVAVRFAYNAACTFGGHYPRDEHGEHLQRRLADGWYAIHTCLECQREKNEAGRINVG